MNDVFDHIIKPYLESKEKGWSPFELHIVSQKYKVGTVINDVLFQSYRCLLKRELDNGHKRYYDMSQEQNEDGTLSLVHPRVMNLRNVFSSFTGITTFGNFRQTCYIIIVNRNSKEVVECSGLMYPYGDRQLYMRQFRNMFTKFDSMVIESNIEDVIKRRFEISKTI